MLCLALSLWNRCSSRESLKKIVNKKEERKKEARIIAVILF